MKNPRNPFHKHPWLSRDNMMRVANDVYSRCEQKLFPFNYDIKETKDTSERSYTSLKVFFPSEEAHGELIIDQLDDALRVTKRLVSSTREDSAIRTFQKNIGRDLLIDVISDWASEPLTPA